MLVGFGVCSLAQYVSGTVLSQDATPLHVSRHGIIAPAVGGHHLHLRLSSCMHARYLMLNHMATHPVDCVDVSTWTLHEQERFVNARAKFKLRKSFSPH